ncbi:MAG: phage tail tape measure protein [Alloprevotella sp.]
MANYTSTAQVVLSVNGKQAQQMLSSLEKDAKHLEKQIEKAAKAGDKATMKKLQRELNATQRTMEQLKGSAATCEQVLHRLDKATPRELNKTLKQLKNELNGIERGTAAWDAQIEKIKAVKREIDNVNSAMREQQSLSDRVINWINKWQMALLAVGAAITGLVMAGRKAVNAYAEMEQEMANVRKFTGMSAEEVGALNEEFKKIDTRTPREELNQLAQEAGRLGKNSQEDVLGFVRAADKINVALDDLGSGATLTLSKLTGIFGDEKRLGTEKALLSVGSVINELSQNCSASAPYIAEFASRMGGVGAQAGMTVQQIMGFAAVLDSNNQKLEASSTALSQVIVRIYQDPAKYAKVAGMDVQKFAKLVKTDMNAALIEFLSTLKRAGSMDVLSPMFKDMGENGSRAISALSTLANHIDDVKSQQLVANEAFAEATSIDKEFEVQNNTVQAQLDKAKNRVHELAVELGEKLQPVMRLVISSSTIALKALSAMVDFFIKYRKEIIAGVTAIAAYNAIMIVYRYHTVMATKATTLFHGAMRLVRMILPTVRLLFTPLVNAVQYFTNGLQVNYAMQERWRKSMAAMKFSNWVGLVLALGAAVYALANRWKTAREEAEKARKEQEEYQKSLTDLDEASAEYSSKEISRLDALYKAATDEKKSKDERRKAAERLQALYPDYFKNLSTEEIMVGNAKVAYDKLRNSIIEVARARAAAEKIVQNEKELLTLEQQAPGLKSKRDKDKATHDAAVRDWENAREMESYQNYTNSTDAAAGNLVNVAPYARKVASTGETYNASEAAYQANLRKQRQLNEANEYLRKKYEISADALAEPETPNVPITYTGGGTDSNKNTDKFAKEKDWREQEEASARIAYATGETDYIVHTKRMDEIAVEFYERQLRHTDLTESERLKITAEWREAQRKQQEHINEQTIDEENNRYNTQLAELKQLYIDGSISKETYDLKTEEAEIEHQRRLVALTKEGSRERLQAEQQLQSLLIAQMQRKQQETERLEAKYAAMKKDYFGDNPQEAQAKYDADLAMLDVVYQRELQAAEGNAAEKLRIDEAYEKAKLALKKKYGLLAEEDTRNAMEKGIADSIEWLNSDGGKALTGTLDTLTSGMSAIFSQLSSMMQAELEMQTAEINKRYDAEISRAEGNSYKVKKLERDKEKEIAKAKKEANRKMFAMQVIQAVAQTATNALNAYGSAAAIPIVGYILAPIAAAMAVAAGAIQIAAIKKQQQQSEATGYESGGFTPKGKSDEVAGVVHKGEWVASRRLVNNPRTRPLLEALDYAQRTNTIGSITAADVSRTITAPAVMAAQPKAPTVVNNTYNSTPAHSDDRMVAVLDRLDTRLNEPFVTVNTVTGDHGMQKAQDDYERLMKNKSPKSRK